MILASYSILLPFTALLSPCLSFQLTPSAIVPAHLAHPHSPLLSRRNDRNDDDDTEYYFTNDNDLDRRPFVSTKRQRMDNLRGLSEESEFNLPSPFGRRSGLRLPETLSKALLAGIFVLGIGTGVTVDSAINTNPKDLASRDAVDRNAPNPTLCTQYGASAMAFDQRVFVSFDPFNVFVVRFNFY